jgi:3-hydroxyacyl-CoA dehydrogenase
MLSRLSARSSIPYIRSFSNAAPVTEIKTVGIVGLGLMGHGIAQMAANVGYKVVGVESNNAALDAAKERIDKSLSMLLAKDVKKGKLTEEEAKAKQASTLGNLTYSIDQSALADCDLIVEAIIEDLDIKIPFYENLGKVVKPEAIFASNTSSLAITKMALASGRADRFVGLHYFNPVQLMRLTEVIKTDHTDPAVFDLAMSWSNSLGKTSVACGDTPGFIVNRLLVPSLSQAILFVERGDATVKDVDVSMQLGAGHPMGPLMLADYVGLDTTLSILEGWVKEYPNEPAFVVPKSLKAKVKAGRLGRKSGHGFYEWNGDKPGQPSTEPLF